jgi:hypothetical protein
MVIIFIFLVNSDFSVLGDYTEAAPSRGKGKSKKLDRKSKPLTSENRLNALCGGGGLPTDVFLKLLQQVIDREITLTNAGHEARDLRAEARLAKAVNKEMKNLSARGIAPSPAPTWDGMLKIRQKETLLKEFKGIATFHLFLQLSLSSAISL